MISNGRIIEVAPEQEQLALSLPVHPPVAVAGPEQLEFKFKYNPYRDFFHRLGNSPFSAEVASAVSAYVREMLRRQSFARQILRPVDVP